MTERSKKFEAEVDESNLANGPVALLASASGLSRGEIKQAMHKGAVWLQRDHGVRRLRRHKARLLSGDRLFLYHDLKVLGATVPPAILVADEGGFSVWDKPPGMRSQGSKWGDHTSLVRFAETELQRVTFLVHRLDQAASGLILVAHAKGTARELGALFERRQMEKIYRVQVHGRFPQAAQHYDTPLDGRAALTHARRLAYDAETDRSELEVRIETGRRHQIRRHLAAVGYPVVGDRRYGKGKRDSPELRLRAVSLCFELRDRRHHYRLD